MKTNEATHLRRSSWRIAFSAALGALLAGACGGTVGSKIPSIGSESHFLAYCGDGCGAGLDCIGGICTRSCLTDQTSCSDLAANAACTNQSVEPGQVAVCDVSCAGRSGCTALGTDYACDGGYCRKANGNGSAGSGGSSTGTGGSSAGGSASGDCNPLGRYEVGKEGGYKPCCPGLTQLQTLSEAYVNNETTRSCVQEPLNSFACIQGFCGDGICEDAEAPCGCGVDCPDSNWRAHPSECESFRDQSPPPDVREISFTNTGSVPLYIQPPFPDCLNQYPLYELQRDGQSVNVAGILFCGFSCQQVMDEGWAYSDPRASIPGPCSKDCAGPAPVLIEPGQTSRQPVSLEVRAEQLPRGCAQGIAVDSIDCFSRVIPQPGNYQLIVRAARAPGASPDLVFTFPTSNYYQSQTFEISAPSN